jgi:hypothetical protein
MKMIASRWRVSRVVTVSFGAACVGFALPMDAQQVPDTVFRPRVTAAAYPAGAGPRIGIDEAHHNYHTAIDRFRPFTILAENDGFRVVRVAGVLDSTRLANLDLLVIANAVHESNVSSWTLPTPSAFTPSEVAAVKAFVERGGALLVLADHMPFAGAAEMLGDAFGVHFINGFAQTTRGQSIFTLRQGTTLLSHVITTGRTPAERIDSVVVFTGSAFSVKSAGAPLMRLPDDAHVDAPTTAWRFPPSTPRTPGDGLLFGVALQVGNGRAYFGAEAAMFSAQLAGAARQPVGFNDPRAPANAQFVLNVLHWLISKQ